MSLYNLCGAGFYILVLDIACIMYSYRASLLKPTKTVRCLRMDIEQCMGLEDLYDLKEEERAFLRTRSGWDISEGIEWSGSDLIDRCRRGRSLMI